MRPVQDDSSAQLSLPHTYRLHRRAALRLMGVGRLSLLAVCSSQSSTDKGTSTSTSSSSSGGNTATSAATSGSGPSSPTSASPTATTIYLRIGEYDALYSLFHSKFIGGNFNWSRLNDPDIDKMLVDGRQEMDAPKRKQIYVDLITKLMDIAPGAPLIDQYSVWGLRSNVSGLKFNGFTYPIVSDMSLSS